MGLFDTLRCEYPLPVPTHQDLEFQTKDLECFMQTYTITRDGRLIHHPRALFADEEGPPTADVEVPYHGDITIYDVGPDPEREWIEYRVRFTHGRVDELRRLGREGEEVPGPVPLVAPAPSAAALEPQVSGRRLTPAEFVACTPEKLELLDGRIPGDRKLLLLLLTSLGLRRTAALVGRERWLQAIEEPRG